MIEIIITIIVGVVCSMVQSVFEGLKKIFLLLLITILGIGITVLQIYLICRWGLTIIKLYAVISIVVLIIGSIHQYFRRS